ncbi:Calcineurin-like phosphoesterase [Microlunatus flavus]|uniref:Calcineurin-like phosphoesterase n=1 Tax=Microlunatus flavus TaxID=1036181 RepID=A0A1H9K5U1_9ACTN|nr:Calcineurin-like phosphoesterase [Microlunatus flavus]
MLARHAARVRSRRTLLTSLARAVAVTLVAAVLSLPLAAAWGVGHARVSDYLGPNRVDLAADYSGEIEIDLGPLGRAYLTSPYAPVGVRATVGGVGESGSTLGSLFSQETLSAYTALYTDPEEAVRGLVERLERDALQRTAVAEAVLLVGFAVWRLRSGLLAPWVVRRVTRRRTLAVYVTVVAVLVGGVLVPTRPDGPRIPVNLPLPDRTPTISVDSALLADLLGRTVSGIRILSARQQAAVGEWEDTATRSLAAQLDELPRPRSGETMAYGFSDLHCNQATTELMSRLVAVTNPSVVLDSGDDTVNGTAAERGCIRRELGIAGGRPFVVATGNHDSDVTEAQLRAAGAEVLDGAAVRVGGLEVLGDDDPERQVPFSVERTLDRPEDEAQLGQRMLQVARPRPVDAILVHQPTAAAPLMEAPDPPARLVLWGHMHAQVGPTVVTHADGSWTVGMQQGTSGGVKQPTLASFSTPFSPPLVRADSYFYFRDAATGLVTGVQPVHLQPDGRVVIDRRTDTGDLAALPDETRRRLSGASPSPTPDESRR